MKLHADMGFGLSSMKGHGDVSVGRFVGWLVAPVVSGRREEGSAVGCGVRVICEGWVPHDPLFVVVRCLTAGAAGGRLVVGCP